VARRALSRHENTRLRSAVGAYLAYQTFASINFFWPIFVVFYQGYGRINLSAILFLQAFYTISRVLLEVPLGLVADRFGRRLALATSAAMLLLGCAAILSSPTLVAFYLGELCFAVSVAAKSGADSALLYDTLSEFGQAEDYPLVEGRAQSLAALGSAVSALLSGFALEWWLPLPYLLTLIAAAATLAAAAMLEEAPRQVPAGMGLRALAWGAVREVLSSAQIAWLIGLYVLLVVLSHVVFYLQQPYLEALEVPVAVFGAVVCAAKLTHAAISSSVQAIERRISPARMPGFMLGAAIAPIFLMSFVPWSIGAILPVLRGVGDGLLMPVVNFYLNRIVAPLRRATVLSLASLFARATQAAVLAGFALLLAHVSLGAVLCMSWVVGGLLAAALLWLPDRAHRPAAAAPGVRLEQEGRESLR
jgi:MFS family permease